MSPHGQGQRDLDELAFPIQAEAAIPPGRLGRTIDEMHRWLLEGIGRSDHATHSGHGLGVDALGPYLRRPRGPGAVPPGLPPSPGSRMALGRGRREEPPRVLHPPGH